ncbi:hypothetical protein Dda_1640 [Drechslerella dactyloides]|uniref:Uncharacterized protein n=1 Tax=Drechslerella dactyloides TaxID=74499 RepID=A0AAD6NKT7_DREDA|nr:hypothetical protein Dda_1640 [Drechslerella dactyloides]
MSQYGSRRMQRIVIRRYARNTGPLVYTRAPDFVWMARYVSPCGLPPATSAKRKRESDSGDSTATHARRYPAAASRKLAILAKMHGLGGRVWQLRASEQVAFQFPHCHLSDGGQRLSSHLAKHVSATRANPEKSSLAVSGAVRVLEPGGWARNQEKSRAEGGVAEVTLLLIGRDDSATRHICIIQNRPGRRQDDTVCAVAAAFLSDTAPLLKDPIRFLHSYRIAMESTRQFYNRQYEKWVPWLEDQYLYYFGRDNKASYVTKQQLDKSKVTGVRQADKLQDDVHGLVAGQVGKDGLLQPVGDMTSKHAVNRAERGGKDESGSYGGPLGGVTDPVVDGAKKGGAAVAGAVKGVSPFGGK